MVLLVQGIENKEKAQALIDKKVAWKSPSGKEIKGKITNLHGNNGAVRAIFEKGMPGQSIGQKVNIQ